MIHNRKITPLLLRFYSRCFLFPYEEMTYELQHIFRQIETFIDDEGDLLIEQEVLAVLNSFQGEDIQNLRSDYVLLFSKSYRSESLCPLFAGEFTSQLGIPYDPDIFVDLLLDSELIPGEEEAMDSIVNYLEYYAFLHDAAEFESPYQINAELFLEKHLQIWIPQFCDLLYKSANVTFYRELAATLKRYILSNT